MLVLVEGAAEAVASSYVEVGDGVRVGDRWRQGVQRAGVCDALVGPVGVVVLFELAQAWSRWRWFQIRVRSRSSRRQVCTHRSMIEFMRGMRIPLSTTLMPASFRTLSNNSGNLPSRSRIRKRARQPVSSRSMATFFRGPCHPGGGWVRGGAQDSDAPAAVFEHGEHVQPRPGQSDGLQKSQASRASAWERVQVVTARSGAGPVPVCLRIFHTVEVATGMPRTSSSPWMRR